MRLKGKIALITGAAHGLGESLAVRFATEGATLILLDRDALALERVDDRVKEKGGEAILVPFDLKQWGGIDQLAAPLYKQFGHLDILIGNAGEGGNLCPIPHGAPEDWERVFTVNVLANWRLLRVCDPLLRLASSGHALFTTCQVTDKNHPYWGQLNASKAALEALVLTYARENEGTSLQVNLLAPPPMYTKMRRDAFPGESPQSLSHPDSLTDAVINILENFEVHGQIISLDPTTS